jgi:ATP-binding cassette, subfamily B, multidrug efflux pump
MLPILQRFFQRFERLADPFPAPSAKTPSASLWRFLWDATKGLRPFLFLMATLSAGIGIFEAAMLAAVGKLVDWLAHLQPGQLFIVHGAQLRTYGLVLAASSLVTLLWALMRFNVIAGNFPMRLRFTFHQQLLQQSMHFFQDEFSGRIAAKLMQSALAVREVWTIALDILVYVSVYFLSLVAILWSFDVRLLAPFLGWLVLYACSLGFFIPKLAKIGELQADARSLMTGRVSDAYTNIMTVKLFSHGERESAYARGAMDEFLGTAYQQMRWVTLVDQCNQLLSVTLIGSTALLSLWLWDHSYIGVGAVAAATAMALRLNGISHWIMWELSSLFENIGTVQDGVGMLSQSAAVVDIAYAKTLHVGKGDICFTNVHFQYVDGKHVLQDFSLHIRAGEKIGLVGRSGAGKSTVVNLLLRFFDLQSGRIEIDGQNIAHVTQTSLRAQIGMVTQDTSLLHRSVHDNIAYGRQDAPDTQAADVHAAAARAQAADFIAGLTDGKGRQGYQAHVGERGVKLSGGQRQRIAIARVMLKDAPILLLDEATSALDSEVEHAIQVSLDALMEGKTVIAIAHRLSTIAAMDRLIVMDQGRIVESGTHRELLAQNGIYAKLWEHQSGGFLGEQ